MQTTWRPHPLPYCIGFLVTLFFFLATQPILADNEFRIGAAVQVPFSITGSGPVFHQTGIRLGLSGQYADVENDKIILNRYIDNYYAANGPLTRQVVTRETIVKDEGNRVIGLEGNLFFEIFNDWNSTVELLGFYGSNAIQGALGVGYSLTHDVFLVGKLMFPYSEVGLRYMYKPEIFFGVKTLGSFDPDTSSYQNDIVTDR